MNKEKISKGICILIIIILFFAGVSKFVSSNSMTLKEYAEQNAASNQSEN